MLVFCYFICILLVNINEQNVTADTSVEISLS